MKIIGHRGAAGLAAENTIQSFKAAIEAGVDMIEFDVRKTKDNQLVVSHDATLKRTFGINKKISDCTHEELKELCPDLPTLQEAVMACQNTKMIIELKEVIDPRLLKSSLHGIAPNQYAFASFLPEALVPLKQTFPDVEFSLLSFWHFGGRINKAVEIGASGIGMHFAMISHFAYRKARRNHLQVYVYTVNSPLIAQHLYRLLPGLIICTNYPDRMQKLRSK